MAERSLSRHYIVSALLLHHLMLEKLRRITSPEVIRRGWSMVYVDTTLLCRLTL